MGHAVLKGWLHIGSLTRWHRMGSETARGRIEFAQARETKPVGASASGVIREIDRANSRVKIDHGPMPTIGNARHDHDV